MMITIAPFTIDTSCYCSALQIEYKKEEQTKRNHLLITYWGIWLKGQRYGWRSNYRTDFEI
jgi:hypothetical protein